MYTIPNEPIETLKQVDWVANESADFFKSKSATVHDALVNLLD